MRFVDFKERSIPISRYADASIPSGGLDTSIVALTTDVVRDRQVVIGYGFTSIGRFAQSGLIRERFAPRLLSATSMQIMNGDGTNVDPFKAWNIMMKGEKPGGHGERCVAVGALDMAVWDAASKIAGVPLHRFLRDAIKSEHSVDSVCVYASGGYLYPSNDAVRLAEETRSLLACGYSNLKMKVGAAPLERDLARVETVLSILHSGERLAVDAMNQFDGIRSVQVAKAIAPYGLWFLEDICNPLDFETLRTVAQVYEGRIAAGEALFSDDEAKLLAAYGGLRCDRDILQFDPAHCYGVPGFLRIVDAMLSRGWGRESFWPHGGHLYTLHIVGALGLGGSEMNPQSFQPFGGTSDGVSPEQGRIPLPESPGIGFETKAELHKIFQSLSR